MIRQRLFITAAALALGFSVSPVLAASSGGDAPGKAGASKAAQLDCEKLKGAARETCLKEQATRTPGRSEGAAAREGGNTPGKSEDAASRTGIPPGKFDSSPAGSPAAGGSSKDKGVAK